MEESRNPSISFRFLKSYIIILNFFVVYYNVSLFVSDLACLFLPLVSWAKGLLLNCAHVLRNKQLYFINLCSDFSYFLLTPKFRLICSCFSIFLSCIIKSFVCTLSGFLMWELRAVTFPRGLPLRCPRAFGACVFIPT